MQRMADDDLLKQEIARREKVEQQLSQFAAARQKQVEELEGEIVYLEADLTREISRREAAQVQLQRARAEFQIELEAREAELAFERAFLKDATFQRDRSEDALRRATKRLSAEVVELEQVNREMSLLNDLGDLLLACPTKEDAFTSLSQRAPQLFPGVAGLLGLAEPSQRFIEVVADWGADAARTHRFPAMDCWAIRRGIAHQVENTSAGLLCLHLPRQLPASYVCLPIMSRGKSLGVIHLSQQEPGGFTDSKKRVVAAVAGHIGQALTKTRFHETLLSQSIRDPLTGLFSRRFMEESLTLELSRATRTHNPLGVVMVELDSFGSFEEALGRDASDAILSEIAFFLQNRFRTEDITCRYEAHKFAAILPDTSLDIASQRTVEIHEEIGRAHV